ncbi:MAG: prephenate dehydrogenase [Planctomycetaceae bacterium]
MTSLPTQFHGLKTVVIVGVGLIGGSIAAALKSRGFRGKIVGVGRDRKRLADAQSAGLVDVGTLDLAEAAADADLFVFCTPVDRIAAGVHEAARWCRTGTLITDTGSVKGSICHALSSGLPGGATFIGSHPLAGSERQGFEHADADLFEGRVCVVTPDVDTPAEPLRHLESFWQSMGCAVVKLSAADHDRALAETSHLPHAVAAALAATLSPGNRQLAASGFCDTTRVAAGDPDLWTAILLANSDEMAERLSAFGDKLDEFAAAIAKRDEAVLKRLLQQAKTARESVDCRGRTD